MATVVAFVQPFGIASPGGGPRILRSLIREAPVKVHSISTGAAPPPHTTLASEEHVPARRRMPLEDTRLGLLAAGALELSARRRFARDLAEAVRACEATHVHVVAHGLDAAVAARVARDAGLPLLVSFHDHLPYVLRDRPEQLMATAIARRLWRESEARFVVTEAMGRYYSARFGARSWRVVTDGTELHESVPRDTDDGTTVYFMGSLHISYNPNLDSLAEALPALDDDRGTARFLCRGGTPPVSFAAGRLEVRSLGAESEARSDLRDVDVLYLPLPFGRRHSRFVGLSLPTKMVTYLGADRPIVLHGPSNSSSAKLLGPANAAVIVDSLDPSALARGIAESQRRTAELVANARSIARASFDSSTIRERFWSCLR